MFPSLDIVLAPPAGGIWAAGGPCQVLSGQAVARLQLAKPGGEALIGPRHRFLFSQGRYFRLLVLASIFLAQPLASFHFFSEKSRLTLRGISGAGKSFL